MGFLRTRTLAMGLVLTLGAVVAPVTADATPPILRPSTRQMWAAFEMGGAMNISKHLGQFKIAQVFGYHLNGGGDGLAIGASMQESFGDYAFTLQIGPRVWYDFQPIKDLGLYLSPVAQLGWALTSVEHGDTINALNLQFGFEPRLMLGDRAMVYLRFFTIDMWIGSEFRMRYDFMLGGGMTF